MSKRPAQKNNRKRNKPTAQKPKFGKLKIFIKLTFAILALYAFGWGVNSGWESFLDWFETTSWGKLQNVEIRGLERLPESAILDILDIKTGAGLMHLDLSKYEEKVTSLAGIKETRIRRKIPGKLIVMIVERRPVASVSAGELKLVDAEGVVFPVVNPHEIIDLPVVSCNYGKSDAASEKICETVNFVLNIKEKYPVLYTHLSEISTDGNGIKLYLRRGGALIKSEQGYNVSELDVLDAFLKNEIERLPLDLELVDLSFEGVVIARAGKG